MTRKSKKSQIWRLITKSSKRELQPLINLFQPLLKKSRQRNLLQKKKLMKTKYQQRSLQLFLNLFKQKQVLKKFHHQLMKRRLSLLKKRKKLKMVRKQMGLTVQNWKKSHRLLLHHLKLSQQKGARQKRSLQNQQKLRMRFQNLKYRKRLLKWRKLLKQQKPSPDFLKEKLHQPLRKELLKRQKSQFKMRSHLSKKPFRKNMIVA